MDDADLKARLTADAPPARDFAFELAVMARIERQQFRRALLRNMAVAAMIALVMALLASPLENFWRHNFAPVANNVTFAALLLLVTIFWPQLTARRD